MIQTKPVYRGRWSIVPSPLRIFSFSFHFPADYFNISREKLRVILRMDCGLPVYILSLV